MNTIERGCAYVDLDIIRHNVEAVKERLNKDTNIMLIVKADAYGHGANKVASDLESLPYVKGFGVATGKEALNLRVAGITKDILILGYSFKEEYEYIVENDIICCIYTLEAAESLSATAVALGKTARIHLKIDTGMSRIGFSDTDTSLEIIKKIYELRNIKVEGTFTHFAKADEENNMPTLKQLSRFNNFINKMEFQGLNAGIRHCCNSAGALLYPEANMDMVRLGIIAYGMFPSEYVKDSIGKSLTVKPALSLISHVTCVKNIDAGTEVGYGGTFVAKKKMTIATVPIGYADGYPRSLSNNGYVIINNEKAPILGNICMDQFMVDVTHIPEVKISDKAVIIGKSENQDLAITIDELGKLSDRFNYEFACNIGARIPRIYVTN